MLELTNLNTAALDGHELSFEEFREIVVGDYRIALESRQASLLGRKEVLTGKAKFGIFGDGKELAQIAMAKVFRDGDIRSGYYRDQTLMFATGISNLAQFFAQLYAHTDINFEPHSAGRAMSCHFATRSLKDNGEWNRLTGMKNTSADISPTAGQMPRLLGLAYASKLYRENPSLSYLSEFSKNGNEIAFGTIGNASTSEGLFFEAVNAAGVLQVPMLLSVWDDEFGISVPAEFHTTKRSISEALKGFQRDENGEGYEIFTVRGWDYPALCETYETAERICRDNHIPVLVHVTEMTQPQGHSTSGSHERYKTKERLIWEQEFDCVRKMKEWMIESAIATQDELTELETETKALVRDSQKKAWIAFTQPIAGDMQLVLKTLELANQKMVQKDPLNEIRNSLQSTVDATNKDLYSAVRRSLWLLRFEESDAREILVKLRARLDEENKDRFNSYLFTGTASSAINVKIVPAQYSSFSRQVDGREILQACFDAALDRDPRVLAFGEDVGRIGDVNQGFAGLQAKYGDLRVIDTGIREATIIGQGIGLAMRGLKPIAEIQYLDYLLYALEPLSDDLASLSYRTRGGQKAPLIVRTRGHRLEGTWHSGSPMGMILGALRGMHVLVPRNMTQAAGFYNTLLLSDEPALLIETLNAYRLKELLPDNIGDFTVPLGTCEILATGSDITIVTYGATCRIAMEAVMYLNEIGISAELIDVQTLLPFDIGHMIVESVKKTNRILFLDEDVPGGASAYMMQQVLEHQGAYFYLDAEPRTLTAKDHRTAYGTDGDYFSKPSADDVFETVYGIMRETSPEKYPSLL